MSRTLDVQVVRPNYYPTYQEQRNMQPYLYNGARPAMLNDGFVITDNSASQGTVIAVDGQSRSAYDQMVKQNFKYTQDNYQEAYKEAARTGKPIVAIFGGFEHNNTRQLVENSLPQAKSGAANDAVYIYVDRAKCKNPQLAAYADSQLAGGHNAAVSTVFTVKPGENGSLQPEAPSFRWQGADRSMIASFNQAISQAKSKQESYTGQFNPAEARSAHKTGANIRYSDGVVVRKNADGTVETFDAASAPEPLADGGAPQNMRHVAAPRAYSRVIGGVHVRRNADGTIETYEAPSRPVPLYPIVRQSKSHRHAK